MTTALSRVVAAIIAGGRGTRLRPVVADRPKVLAEVKGRPFVTYVLDQLAAAGVSRAVLCTGFRAEQVRRVVGCSHAGMQVQYSEEKRPLGTGGALKLALPLLASDPILVLNGDSLCRADLNAFADEHRRRGAVASILVCQVPESDRYGQVVVDGGGRIRAFREKSRANRPSLVSVGVYLLARSVVVDIESERSVSLEREVFPRLVGDGLYASVLAEEFIDIGTPESYARAQAVLA